MSQDSYIEFEGFKVRHKKRAYQRSLNLHLKESGELLVTSGKSVSLAVIQGFLWEKKEWIKEKSREWRREKRKLPPITFSDGEAFYFKGGPLFLYKREHEKKRFHMSSDGVHLNCLVPKGATIQQLHQAIRHFYKTEGIAALKAMVSYWQSQIGLTPVKVSFREQKTCWGSCSSKGTISLNWKLIVAPESVMQYVVIHEIIHLRYLNHSQGFWKLVERFCPDYEYQEKWLKKHNLLFRFLDKGLLKVPMEKSNLWN